MSEMLNNGFVALLQHDKLQMKHPSDKKKYVTLHRVIATKLFKIGERVIKLHAIGGYVESLKNFDPESPAWLENSARVFDNAIIRENTIVSDYAMVYENAIVENCSVKNYARIHGHAQVNNSLLTGLCEVKGNVRVNECELNNSAMVFEDAVLIGTTMAVGSNVRGTSKVVGCTITDTSQIQGDAQVTNCTLTNRSVIMGGVHENQFFDDDDLLRVTYGEGEMPK